MRHGGGDPSQWFVLSTFTTMPVNMEYGFHWLLMPFTVGDLFVGGKLAAIVGMTVFAVVCWWILTRLGIGAPALWSAAGLVASPVFFHGMTQLRPSLLTTSLLVLGLYGLVARRWLFVGVVVAGWTWLHHGYPLLLGAIGLYAALELIRRRTVNWQLLAATAGGWLVGLACHPTPLWYTRLLFLHLYAHVRVSLLGTPLPFATELRPWSWGAVGEGGLILLYLANTLWLWRHLRSRRGRSHAADAELFLWIVLTVVWALALRHYRFIDYLVPVTTLTTAYLWRRPWGLLRKSQHRFATQLIRHGAVSSRVVTWLLGDPSRLMSAVTLVFVLTGGAYATALATEASVILDASLEEPRRVGEWLGAHTPRGSVVAQTAWDRFPWLFFYDYDSRFLNGFDPIDSYLANPRLFWRWFHLVRHGTWCNDAACPPDVDTPHDLAQAAAQLLREEFHTDYLVLFRSQSSPAFSVLADDARFFEPVFRTPRSAIYRIRPFQRPTLPSSVRPVAK